MYNAEVLFVFDLRVRVENLVEQVGTFPVRLITECNEDGDYPEIELHEMQDAIKQTLESKTGETVLNIASNDIWVTFIESQFNPFTFDINGKQYYCVQVTDPDVIKSYQEE